MQTGYWALRQATTHGLIADLSMQLIYHEAIYQGPYQRIKGHHSASNTMYLKSQ